MRRILITLLLAMTLVPMVEARTVISPSKQKSASLASVVAKMEITKRSPLMVGESECAYEYEAKVLSVKKGVMPRTTKFRFGVLGGLEVGRRYVIYLRNLGTKSEFAHLMEEKSAALVVARPIIDACPVALPIPVFFRADRISND